MSHGKVKKQRSVREGLFHLPSSPTEKPCLMGSKCRECGYVSFPQRPVCPFCLEEGTMDRVRLGSRGKINTFTISRVAPRGFSAPYVQAYVDLPEGPRVFSIIAGCDPSKPALEIGSEVELVIERLCEDDDGTEIIGYKFRPI